MSRTNRPRYDCKVCAVKGLSSQLRYAGATRNEEGTLVCVARRCGRCAGVVMEAFPPGPVPPVASGACLGCGAPLEAAAGAPAARCRVCGLGDEELREQVGETPELARGGAGSSEVAGAAAAAAAWVDRACARIGEGELRGAMLALGLALRLDPAHERAWELKAVLLRRVDFPEVALRCLDEAAARGCEGEALRVERGIVFLQLGRYDEGLRSFETAIALEPGGAVNARVHRGIALRKLGRHAEAIAEFRRVLELRREETSAWYNLAAALFEDNRALEAEPAVLEALRLEPGLLPAASLAGDIRLQAGDPGQALAWYDRALALLPPGAYDASLMLRRGTTLDRLGRLREAADALKDILRSCPGDRTVMSTLAGIEERLAVQNPTCDACLPE